jgi:hypothetical protein
VIGALILNVALASPTRLTVSPWTGSNMATATSAAIRYRLRIEGAPNATLVLRADKVAKGWLAAFCTPRVCSPMRVDVTLPQSGRAEYLFEMIREGKTGPPHSGARITSSDGATIVVAPP